MLKASRHNLAVVSTCFVVRPCLQRLHMSTLAEFAKMGKKQMHAVTPLDNHMGHVKSLHFYIETYGCQMNLSDSEIVRSILISAGHKPTFDLNEAELVLTNTCAIRENAETKVWNRLKFFQSLRRKNHKKGAKSYTPMVGILGCMAERLKTDLLKEDSVDFVCGPDAYRDMPQLLQNIAEAGQKQANTILSFDETYADISPVREVNRASAFVSIMRGCNNMCSYCIVPFTRGRERSRPFESILSEVTKLSNSGVKEVVLLGQNVNGYHDISPTAAELFPTSTTYSATPGFSNLYNSRKRDRPGARFSDLLHAVADIDPNMRIRFTSPHPKDFPADALAAVAERTNICNSIHMPAQSGSTTALARMRRGYSREAFIALVERFRSAIPGVAISTDIIAGFCGETESEHKDTLSLIAEVQFDQAFMYAYSLRERTHAERTMQDDVPEEVKKRRLQEIIDMYRTTLIAKNKREEHGQLRLVLVEGPSTKSVPERPMFTGRTEENKRLTFPATDLIPVNQLHGLMSSSGIPPAIFTESVDTLADRALLIEKGLNAVNHNSETLSLSTALYGNYHGAIATPEEVVGQYVAVRVLKGDSPTMRGVALGTSNIQDFAKFRKQLDIKL